MTAWEAIRETPKRIGEVASSARPHLRAITSPPRRLSPISFAVFVITILIGGMVGLLALTTALQNQAFAVRDAERTASELGYRASDLEAQVNRAKAPEALGRRATELGMVPNPHAVFIDVRTGEVLGEPIAARGDEMPSLKVSPAVVPSPPPVEAEVPAEVAEAPTEAPVEADAAQGEAPAPPPVEADAQAAAAPDPEAVG